MFAMQLFAAALVLTIACTWVLAAAKSSSSAAAPPLPKTRRRQLLLIVDPFSEYIGGIAKEYCKQHRIEVVECLSPYLCGYFKSKGSVVPAAFRAPEEGRELAWAVRRGVLKRADVSRRKKGKRSKGKKARASDSEDVKEDNRQDEDEDVEEEFADDDDEDENVNRGLSDEEMQLMAPASEGRDVVCVLSESDSGVSTALRLQRALGLRRCSFEGMPEGDHLAAQNKFLQNENGRRAGLKTVRQVLARQWSEAEPFVDELLGSATSDAASFVVIKPYRGVASDGVFKAGSRREARQAFESLLGGARFGGGANDAVLLQEFASGTEYAVDTVARDGEVKVVALWRYRKLAANGAPFVYQCSELVDASSEEAVAVCDYAVAMLHAQGMRWGATHTEVMYTSDGPRLIEINPRWHAQHFAPLAQRCLGYDAVTATMDAFFSAHRWAALPERPPPLRQAGRILHLISYRKGTVSEVHHVDEIDALQSTILLDLHAEPGSAVVKTVDIRTDCGYVLLCHEDSSVVEADYDAIVAMQRTMIDVKEEREAEDVEEAGEERSEERIEEEDVEEAGEDRITVDDDEEDGDEDDEEDEADARSPAPSATSHKIVPPQPKMVTPRETAPEIAPKTAAPQAVEALAPDAATLKVADAAAPPRRSFIDEDDEEEEVYLKSYDYNNNNFNSVRNYELPQDSSSAEAPQSLVAAVLVHALQSKNPLLKLIRRSAALLGISYVAAAATIIAAPYINDIM